MLFLDGMEICSSEINKVICNSLRILHFNCLIETNYVNEKTDIGYPDLYMKSVTVIITLFLNMKLFLPAILYINQRN